MVINHTDFQSINYNVTDGVAVNSQATASWARNLVEASALNIDGKTISFEFTPLQHSGLAFQVQSTAAADAYSVTFALTVFENIIEGTSGADKTNGTVGIDVMTGLVGNDQLDSKDGDDILDGGAGKDKLSGGSGDGTDILNGDAGTDKMYCDAGADVLTGGRGKDVMSGDTGTGIFIFETCAHLDTITDFENGVDVLDFSATLL